MTKAEIAQKRAERIQLLLDNKHLLTEELAVLMGLKTHGVTQFICNSKSKGLLPADFSKLHCRKSRYGTENRTGKAVPKKRYKKPVPGSRPKRGDLLWDRGEMVTYIQSQTTITRAGLAAHYGINLSGVDKRLGALLKEGLLTKEDWKTRFRRSNAKVVKPRKRAPKTKVVKQKPVHKPQPKRVIVNDQRKRAPIAKRQSFETTHNPETLRIHNRDIGKVLVRVDSRTQKYVSPDKVHLYQKSA